MCTVLTTVSSNDKTKSLFTPWKLESINPLNPDFNCCGSFVLYWVDRLFNGTSNFVSVITKVVFLSTSQMIEFPVPNQVRIRLISQVIKGISRVLHKLLRYFNDTAIFTSLITSFQYCFQTSIWIEMM